MFWVEDIIYLGKGVNSKHGSVEKENDTSRSTPGLLDIMPCSVSNIGTVV